MRKPELYKGKLVIPILTRNNEDIGSITYNREYKLYDYDRILEFVEQVGDEGSAEERVIEVDDLDKRFLYTVIEVSGTTLPFKEPEENLPPVSFKEKSCFKIQVAREALESKWELKQ